LLSFQILKWDITEKDVIYKKISYNVFHWPPKVSPPLCHTRSLFLNEIMKNQVLNKIVCSVSLLCDEELFFIPQFFSLFFSTFPQTPAAHLRTLCVTSVCHGISVENRWYRASYFPSDVQKFLYMKMRTLTISTWHLHIGTLFVWWPGLPLLDSELNF
jgi:hypothetical protein